MKQVSPISWKDLRTLLSDFRETRWIVGNCVFIVRTATTRNERGLCVRTPSSLKLHLEVLALHELPASLQ
jgi:hypothetical protein